MDRGARAKCLRRRGAFRSETFSVRIKNRGAMAAADLVIIHCKDGKDWAEYLMDLTVNKFDPKSLNYHFEHLENLSIPLQLSAVHHLRDAKVVILLITPEFVDFIEEYGADMSILCRRLPSDQTVIILCGVRNRHLTSYHKEALVSYDSWRRFTIRNSYKTGVFTFLDEIIGMVKKAIATQKQNPLHSFIHMIPHKVKEGNGKVCVILSNPVHYDDDIQIILEADGKSLRLPVKIINPYTVQYVVPDKYLHTGKIVNIHINCNGHLLATKQLKIESKKSELISLLMNMTSPVQLMCEMFGFATVHELDMYLAENVRKNLPAAGFHFFGSLFNCQNIAENKSEEQMPTLLHFAAAYGLKELTLLLLMCPGARLTCYLKNVNGHTPAQLAYIEQHKEISEMLEGFQKLAEIRKDASNPEKNISESIMPNAHPNPLYELSENLQGQQSGIADSTSNTIPKEFIKELNENLQGQQSGISDSTSNTIPKEFIKETPDGLDFPGPSCEGETLQGSTEEQTQETNDVYALMCGLRCKLQDFKPHEKVIHGLDSPRITLEQLSSQLDKSQDGERKDSASGESKDSAVGGRKSSAGGSRKNSSGGSRKNSAGGERKNSAGGERKNSGGGERKNSGGGERKNSAGGERKNSAGGERKDSPALIECSQRELMQILESFKNGHLTIIEVEQLCEEWHTRHRESLKSTSRNDALYELKEMYRQAQKQKVKKQGFFSEFKQFICAKSKNRETTYRKYSAENTAEKMEIAAISEEPRRPISTLSTTSYSSTSSRSSDPDSGNHSDSNSCDEKIKKEENKLQGSPSTTENTKEIPPRQRLSQRPPAPPPRPVIGAKCEAAPLNRDESIKSGESSPVYITPDFPLYKNPQPQAKIVRELKEKLSDLASKERCPIRVGGPKCAIPAQSCHHQNYSTPLLPPHPRQSSSLSTRTLADAGLQDEPTYLGLDCRASSDESLLRNSSCYVSYSDESLLRNSSCYASCGDRLNSIPDQPPPPPPNLTCSIPLSSSTPPPQSPLQGYTGHTPSPSSSL